MGGFLGVSLLLALAGGEVSSGVRPQGAHQGHRDDIVRRRQQHCGAGKELVLPTHKARMKHTMWFELPCSPNCDTFAGAGWPLSGRRQRDRLPCRRPRPCSARQQEGGLEKTEWDLND